MNHSSAENWGRTGPDFTCRSLSGGFNEFNEEDVASPPLHFRLDRT